MSFFIFQLIGGILIIFLCLYILRKNKIYDKPLNILHTMVKNLEKKPEKPNNLNSFWKLYSDERKEIKESIESLKFEFKNIKKHNYWIPIGIAIFTAILFLTSVVIQYYDASGGFIQKPEIIGYEIINTITNSTEKGYRVWLHNAGEINAKDITIKISFEKQFQDASITDIFKHSEEIIVKNSEFGGIGGYKYGLKYSELLVGEDANLTLFIQVDNLEKYENNMLWPTTQVWIGDNPPINLIRRNDITFWH